MHKRTIIFGRNPLEHKIAAQEQERWVSVSEREPREDEYPVVCYSWDDIPFCASSHACLTCYSARIWMPLSAPPTERTAAGNDIKIHNRLDDEVSLTLNGDLTVSGSAVITAPFVPLAQMPKEPLPEEQAVCCSKIYVPKDYADALRSHAEALRRERDEARDGWNNAEGEREKAEAELSELKEKIRAEAK